VPESLQPLHLALAAAAAFLLLALFVYWRGLVRQARTRELLAELRARSEQLAQERERLQGEVTDLQANLARQQGENRGLAESVARLEARHQAEGRAAEEKIALLQGAREQLTAEFNNLANRIFQEKSERLVTTNRESMETTLGPLRTQLEQFRKKVEDVYDRETRDRVSLRHELSQLKALNLKMSEDAVNLTRALKGDKKTQGNWGEIVLERVLEESGLRKGHEYETQVSMRAEDGRLRLPDVIIRLPDNKDVVVDAKVSLVDYEQYVNAEGEAEKQAALQRHLLALRNHIAGLSIKEYEKLDSLRSLDFVLLFIPIESAFIAAYDADPQLFLSAYDKQVIVVGPTNLLATLRTIQTIWRYDQQNRNAERIAALAGRIHDQFALVVEAMDDVKRGIDRAQQAWETAHRRFSTGKGNLVRRVQQLEQLGARTGRQLPSSVVSEEDDDLPGLEAGPIETESDKE
jgi:DNA recombination protein RmuC